MLRTVMMTLALLLLMTFAGYAQETKTGVDVSVDQEIKELALRAYGVPDYKKAALLFTQTANQGDADSQYYLGRMHFFGLGVPEDYETAIFWYLKAAKQGHAKDQLVLGDIYSIASNMQSGSEQKWEYKRESFTWRRKAAEQGMARAQHRVAEAYENGWGVSQSSDQAAVWYRKAAEQGFEEAQFDLGVLYFRGGEFTKDLVFAHFWFNLAAISGDPQAAKNRDIVLKEMTPADISKAQKLASDWFAARQEK
ncbi:MAG: sel1 repeat family protein [Robiginitomaculum sp.]|nr:sel1 repeat family protein [Robiginitomaculum sp.]